MSIGEFFDWWRSELAGMLPEALRRRFARRRDTLVLSPSNHEVRVSRRQNGRLEALGRVGTEPPGVAERMAAILGNLSSASTRVEVEAPPEKLLVKQIQLPLAAEENLRQVLGFEMQRQTPFRAEQVFFNYRITDRRPQSQQIVVRLCVVPRAAIEPALAPFVEWNLVPVDSAKRSNEDDAIFAFVSGDSAQHTSSRFHRSLVAANLLLLAIAVAIPFVQQHRYLGELRDRLAEVREAATTASDLMQRINAQRARIQYLFSQKVAQPAAVALLEELTRRLPDDTWLFRVELRGGDVHLQGTSKTASALIAELEGSPFLENVHFASPITQDGGSGRERFHLSARVLASPAQALAGNPEGGDT